jgi:hypothetical protein
MKKSIVIRIPEPTPDERELLRVLTMRERFDALLEAARKKFERMKNK